MIYCRMPSSVQTGLYNKLIRTSLPCNDLNGLLMDMWYWWICDLGGYVYSKYQNNKTCLLSETEEGLQKLLDKVYEWSKKWKIKFNAPKSKILHIRQPHLPRTDYSFKLGDINLSKVEQYKCLDIVIN